ncbi:cyanophycinase [Paludibacter propionicigenes]|nr:cyanophycinase [Paludibacter propionicigenes]
MKKVVMICMFAASILATTTIYAATKKGSLLIIGGGKVNVSMRDQMLKASGLDKAGYMVILPMSSEEEPLVNAEEIRIVFKDIPNLKIYTYNIQKGDPVSAERLDSIRNACLVFISGGDQMRFLDITKGTGINEAIHDAYNKGALIAGTSAGASLMSKIMVTGNALKHPDDNFTCIEAGNVETKEGLGFLENVTIDQHFVVRKRYNRMLSYGLENPNHMSIGIDEATAIFVEGKKATVFGVSQVIVLRNKGAKIFNRNGQLSAQGLKLDVYLAGDSFKIY